MVVALGVAWVLDGLEITIAANVVADLTQKSTLNLSASQAADLATPSRGGGQRRTQIFVKWWKHS